MFLPLSLPTPPRILYIYIHMIHPEIYLQYTCIYIPHIYIYIHLFLHIHVHIHFYLPGDVFFWPHIHSFILSNFGRFAGFTRQAAKGLSLVRLPQLRVVFFFVFGFGGLEGTDVNERVWCVVYMKCGWCAPRFFALKWRKLMDLSRKLPGFGEKGREFSDIS